MKCFSVPVVVRCFLFFRISFCMWDITTPIGAGTPRPNTVSFARNSATESPAWESSRTGARYTSNPMTSSFRTLSKTRPPPARTLPPNTPPCHGWIKALDSSCPNCQRETCCKTPWSSSPQTTESLSHLEEPTYTIQVRKDSSSAIAKLPHTSSNRIKRYYVTTV